ncbi:hypothetical protein [Polaromonas sp.]|uniref:hypothetical protein n=1 Tax=Polaromonas sp. TaxID=1869339 RepID=UPI0013BB8290|nr:hypothetical protein [Polaromonas sp.]NDP64654.1 hypothetical protein [Polaromonas sp.]
MKPDAIGIGLAKQFFQVHGIKKQAGTCSTQRQLTLQRTYSAFSPASRPLDAAMKNSPPPMHSCAVS